MGTSGRAQSAKGARTTIPGPGQYQTTSPVSIPQSITLFQKALLNGPQYTIRIKPQLGGIGSVGKNMNNPGPGQYQQDSAAVNKTIAYTFGMKTGSSMRPGSAHVPGP